MVFPYRFLLYLYPSAYRAEYGEEMMDVLFEVQKELGKKGVLARIVREVHEAGGLLRGALREHARSIICSYGCALFPPRRLTMRSEFRFPKTTVSLMAVILAAILLAIDKAKAIQASIPYANPGVGPIQPAQFTILPTLLLVLVGACITGVIGWAILFALHRSGVHRLSEVDPSRGQGARRRLSI